MPLLDWNDSLSTGIEKFDEHHRQLFDLLNTVYDDFITGAPPENIGRVLDELVDYATYHFAIEEQWFQKISYPKLAEHHVEHERYSKRVAEIRKDFHAGKGNLTLEVLSFLNSWLTEHILKSDAEYAIPHLFLEAGQVPSIQPGQ